MDSVIGVPHFLQNLLFSISLSPHFLQNNILAGSDGLFSVGSAMTGVGKTAWGDSAGKISGATSSG